MNDKELYRRLEQIKTAMQMRESLLEAVEGMGGEPDLTGCRGSITHVKVGGKIVLDDSPMWLPLPNPLQSRLDRIDRRIVNLMRDDLRKKALIYEEFLQQNEFKE